MPEPVIICVEDEQDVCLAIEFQLIGQSPGYQVEFAASGSEALQRLEQLSAEAREVPLLIVDQTLPEMRGDQLLLEIHRRHPQSLILLLIDPSGVEDLVEMINRGILYRFILKPWNELDLRLTVTEALRRYWQEQQLFEQQAKLAQVMAAEQQTILENIPCFVTKVDRAGTMLFLNRTAAGFTQDIIGRNLNDFLVPESREIQWAALARVFATGQPETIETFGLGANSSLTYYEVRLSPLIEAGQITAALMVSTDITERKQAEAALLQSQAKQNALISALPDLIMCIGSDGIYRNIVAFAGFRMLGNAHDLIGKHVEDSLPPILAQRRLDAIQTTLQTGHLQVYEQELWIEGALQIEECRVVVCNVDEVLLIARDITDRKQAEAALQEALEFSQQVINGAKEGVIVFDAELHYRLWNPFMTELSGIPAASVLGQHPLTVFPFLDQNDIYAAIVRALAGDTVTTADAEFYVPQTQKTGWASATFSPLYDAQSQTIGVIGIVSDITERKRAELELREHQAFVQSITTTIAGTIYLYDIQAQCNIYSNRDFLNLLGYSTQEIQAMGAAWLELIHLEDLELVSQHQERVRAAADGEMLALEYRIRHKNGEWFWVQSFDTPFKRDATGQVYQYLGTVFDISDRKQAELELKASQERWALAIEGSNEGIWDHDLITDSHFLSPRCLEIGGYSYAEIDTFEKWLGYVHPDDRSVLHSAFQDYIQKHIPIYRVEYRFRCRDGSEKWLLARGKALWNQAGVAVRFIGSVIDITARKQAELALQQLNAELEQRIQQRTQDLLDSQTRLRAQEQFLRSIYDGTENPIFVIDVLPNGEFRISGWNAACKAITGFSSDAVLGQLPQDAFGLEIGNRVCVNYRRCADTGCMSLYEESYLFPAGEKWMLTRLSPLKDAAGQVVRIVGNAIDITDRKQMEQQLRQVNADLENRVAERTNDLRQALEAAEAANQAKSRFLATMSHELRTPLNAILGFSQLLNRQNALPPEQQQQVSIINRSGKHLLSLINEILEMSKIEAGQATLTVENFDLLNLIQTLQDLFQLKADTKGLQLTVQINSSVPQYIQSDPGKLRQILSNLLGNAIKFTQQGQVTLKVEMASEAGGELLTESRDELVNELVSESSYKPLAESTVELSTETSEPAGRRALAAETDAASSQVPISLYFSVEDTGPGIDPSEQANLFDPFVQTKLGQESQEGTGLGLPISHRFVQMLGGHLCCHSVVEQGSLFWFQIPILPVSPADLPLISDGRRVIGLAPDQPSYRILVVEDQLENRLFLTQLLKSVGFEVQMAEHGQAALTQFHEWQPDLIWMDMRMPVLNGYEATRQIRAIAGTAAPKIIALTASALDEDRSAILAAGCDDLAYKPVTETVLFDKMAKHLGLRYLYAEQPETAPIQPELVDSAAVIALQEMPQA